jgi:hypothetical protein
VELQPVFYEYAYDFHAIFRFFVFFKKRFIPAGCPVRQCCAEGHTPGDAVLEINTESRYSGMPSGFFTGYWGLSSLCGRSNFAAIKKL